MSQESKLIVNSEQTNLLKVLVSALETCERFYFSVAFVNFSGLQLLLDALNEAKYRGVEGRIITSTYLNFTEPKALERLKRFENVFTKVFVTDRQIGFHTEAYIFEYEDYFKVINSSVISRSKAVCKSSPSSTLPPGNSHILGIDISGDRNAHSISCFSFSMIAATTFIVFFIATTLSDVFYHSCLKLSEPQWHYDIIRVYPIKAGKIKRTQKTMI